MVQEELSFWILSPSFVDAVYDGLGIRGRRKVEMTEDGVRYRELVALELDYYQL